MGNLTLRAYGFTEQDAINSLQAQIIKKYNVRFSRDTENRLFVRINGEDKEYVYTKVIRVELQDPGTVYKAYLVG